MPLAPILSTKRYGRPDKGKWEFTPEKSGASSRPNSICPMRLYIDRMDEVCTHLPFLTTFTRRKCSPVRVNPRNSIPMLTIRRQEASDAIKHHLSELIKMSAFFQDRIILKIYPSLIPFIPINSLAFGPISGPRLSISHLDFLLAFRGRNCSVYCNYHSTLSFTRA